MQLLWIILTMPVAYLAGSINFSILIARWAKGIDIRAEGNRNPGTANTGRVLGRGWAALVFLGDLSKGLIPLFLARWLFFSTGLEPDGSPLDFFGLLLTGMAAITGHCWPVYHQFRGGGGLATSIGIYMFFIPVIFFVCLLISFICVQVLFRKKKYSVGQLVPMFFVPMAPLLMCASLLLPELPLTGNVVLGSAPWFVPAGIFILSGFLFIININIVRARFSPGGPA
jgi:glycerol-3-phosphate acyltransferase PlsY